MTTVANIDKVLKERASQKAQMDIEALFHNLQTFIDAENIGDKITPFVQANKQGFQTSGPLTIQDVVNVLMDKSFEFYHPVVAKKYMEIFALRIEYLDDNLSEKAADDV